MTLNLYDWQVQLNKGQFHCSSFHQAFRKLNSPLPFLCWPLIVYMYFILLILSFCMNGLRERKKKKKSVFTCGRIDNKTVLICNNDLGGWITSVVSWLTWTFLAAKFLDMKSNYSIYNFVAHKHLSPQNLYLYLRI